MKAMEKEIVETWENLNEIWSEVGYDPDNLARRQNAVVKHVAVNACHIFKANFSMLLLK